MHVPPLGFVVLTDRYIYSLMARAIVRGADPAWIKARGDSEKDGPILANIKSSFLRPTAFSAVK